jgi:hypothetical protein
MELACLVEGGETEYGTPSNDPIYTRRSVECEVWRLWLHLRRIVQISLPTNEESPGEFG